MDHNTRSFDMLHGALPKSLLLFTLPIALSSILQQLFHAADTAIVGCLGNADALAAVGTNTEIIALIVTVSSGLSIGANILVSRQVGRGETGSVSATVRTALALSLFIGFAGMLLGQAAARPLLQLIRTPDRIFHEAELYLRIYLLGYPVLLLYDFGSAVLRAYGNSRDPFRALTVSGAANVALNGFFVLVCRMGVAGVALATDLSTLLAAVQGAVFCFANLFIQAAVNGFGADAIAGSTIAMNFEYFTYYIITAFGQTATTFTSQNHAACQTDRCRKILWLCLGLSALCSSIPIFGIILFRDFFSGLFTSDPAVIESASVRILCILLFEPLCNLYEIPAGVLRGRGRALYPALSTVLGTCVFRILWIRTVFRANRTLPMLYHAFPLSWCLTILLVGIGFLISPL